MAYRPMQLFTSFEDHNACSIHMLAHLMVGIPLSFITFAVANSFVTKPEMVFQFGWSSVGVLMAVIYPLGFRAYLVWSWNDYVNENRDLYLRNLILVPAVAKLPFRLKPVEFVVVNLLAVFVIHGASCWVFSQTANAALSQIAFAGGLSLLILMLTNESVQANYSFTRWNFRRRH